MLTADDDRVATILNSTRDFRAQQALRRALDAARDEVIAAAVAEGAGPEIDLWARFCAINPISLLSEEEAAEVRAAYAGLVSWPA